MTIFARECARVLVPIAPLIFLAASAEAAPPPSSAAVPLYTDLGNYSHKISSTVLEAQAYFDQGVKPLFGFNHAEAIRSFTEAAKRDPNCAICY
jgi:hypothetical protein